jgi:hypothetical protein
MSGFQDPDRLYPDEPHFLPFCPFYEYHMANNG